MNKQSLKIILSILGLITFVSLMVVFFGLNQRKNFASEFTKFDSMSISGYIDEIKSSTGGVRINLKNGKTFYFAPRLVEGQVVSGSFGIIAGKGDYILKKEFSDTLYLTLVNENRTIKYTFVHYPR
ncbi:hypothetical protein OO013_14570 [Mangrovivirga sp. M17]|uniref:Uncharacterized protein n=1 Tax=Mangrovivirga halotolerans TaxID=2993936 RepID=A0ABT3RUB4_9BACT|nr:hypothetical protein [Mangrovivirga halotolerans]MCX2745101.1 hypothetical protein [Mangrovivirga halotolerans]